MDSHGRGRLFTRATKNTAPSLTMEGFLELMTSSRDKGASLLSLGGLLNKSVRRYVTVDSSSHTLRWSEEGAELGCEFKLVGSTLVMDGDMLSLHTADQVLRLQAESEVAATNWANVLAAAGAEMCAEADGTTLRAPSDIEASVMLEVSADLGTAVSWEEHEELLRRVWNRLVKEDTPFSSAAPAWKTLGFQRDDPVSDFRGGGLAALRWLDWYASTWPDQALESVQVQGELRRLSANERGMPWAAATINVLSLVCSELRLLHSSGGRFGAKRCWGLVSTRDRFNLLVTTAVELLEREFVRDGALYMEFNASLQKCQRLLADALSKADSAASHSDLRHALKLRPFRFTFPIQGNGPVPVPVPVPVTTT
jgi:hypothetical protein